MIEELNQRLKI